MLNIIIKKAAVIIDSHFHDSGLLFMAKALCIRTLSPQIARPRTSIIGKVIKTTNPPYPPVEAPVGLNINNMLMKSKTKKAANINQNIKRKTAANNDFPICLVCR